MLKDFVAFQLAHEFFKDCKRLNLPKFHYDQLLRASSSVALNLAEGSGKRTAAEQARIYGIALGSLRDCEAILILEYVELDGEMQARLNRLGAILYKLSRRDASPNRTVP